MSPNEAAELLGVSPGATRDEVERTYQARLAEAGGDPQRRDALTAARDALVAASAWQPPYPQNATQPYPPQSAPAQPYPPQSAPAQPTQVYPPQNAPTQPQPPFAPQQPYGAPPQTPGGGSYPGAAQGGYPPPGYPQQGYAQAGQPQPGQPQPGQPQPGQPQPGQPQAGQPQPGQPQPGQPAPGYGPGAFGAYQGYPPPPPRKRMSTGAIVGITVGGIVGGLAILLVAVLVIVSIGASTSRIAQAESSSNASPYESDPGDGSSDDPSEEPSNPGSGDPGSGDSEVEDYDVDGVHVHYVDGWTFELTPGQTCAGATVTATFADTPEGETLDSWTTTVDLEAGVPYELTIPDSASEYDYAGIESVQCGQA